MSEQIGIIYSPHYGAGWSTWGCHEMALDQELAIAIHEGKSLAEIHAIAIKNWPNEYLGGLDDCVVEWVDKGTKFKIEEYDGFESITFAHNNYWSVA